MTDPSQKETRPSATREWKGDHPAEGEVGDRYDPTPEEITRLRAQGLGVGAEDLQLQQDPTGSGGDRSLRDRVNRETNEEDVEALKPDRRDGRQ
ncbi:MAG: hypothetical protein K1X35_14845 [Caulobacteraceae bacterium]|nr:hypothetical protein [Caulobacteraceae bacterium]